MTFVKSISGTWRVVCSCPHSELLIGDIYCVPRSNVVMTKLSPAPSVCPDAHDPEESLRLLRLRHAIVWLLRKA